MAAIDKLLLPIHSPDLTYCNCRDDMMLDAVERSKTNRDCRFSVTSKNRISWAIKKKAWM